MGPSDKRDLYRAEMLMVVGSFLAPSAGCLGTEWVRDAEGRIMWNTGGETPPLVFVKIIL